MKTKSFLLIVAVGLCLTGISSAQTNADVQLTPDQVAKLDAAVNQGVSLIPAGYQGIVDSAVGLLVVLGTLGRIYKGWKNNGLPGVIAGVFHGTNAPMNPPPTNIPKGGANLISRLLLCVALPALLLTGCKGIQTTEQGSWSGMKAAVTVPIPFTGGVSLLNASLAVGAGKSTTIIQPVGTNQLYVAKIAAHQYTRGAQNLSGTTGGGTNSPGAGIVAGECDEASIITGEASCSATNGASLNGFTK